MFGALRFFLASLVVIYHAGYTPLGVRVGVSAVIVFYMISGFVISALYSSRFVDERATYALRFYIERFVRIAPQYYFYLIFFLFFLYNFDLWYPAFPAREFTLMDAFTNFTLIPMALTIYFPSLLQFAVIGQAVSLATECLFYFIVPLLHMFPRSFFRHVSVIITMLSLIVFCLATNELLPIVIYSYNFLPGPLIFFFIGYFIYKRQWVYLGSIIFILLVNQSCLYHFGLLTAGFNLDIYVGLYFGLIIIPILKNKKTNYIDNLLGAISYGCFLGHGIILLAFRRYEILSHDKLIFTLLLLFLSLSAGCLSYFLVEKPTLKYRRQFRLKNTLKFYSMNSKSVVISE